MMFSLLKKQIHVIEEVYQASRDAISAHVLKAHEVADPYFQVH
jgi:hypothetical protein